jgi:serine/threonine protein phosphatase PrpC
MQCENDLKADPSLAALARDQGAVAAFVCVRTIKVGTAEESKAYIANLGDVEVVVARSGTAFPLSEKHVASDPREHAAIKQRGGFVSAAEGVRRAQGVLIAVQTKEAHRRSACGNQQIVSRRYSEITN